MKQFLCVTLLCAATLVADVVSAKPLADRHVMKSMDCVTCHGTKAPQPFSEVANETCLKCHGPKKAFQNKYEKKYGKKNPHKNHLGDVTCNLCHKGHAESSVYCENCHKDFKLKIR